MADSNSCAPPSKDQLDAALNLAWQAYLMNTAIGERDSWRAFKAAFHAGWFARPASETTQVISDGESVLHGLPVAVPEAVPNANGPAGRAKGENAAGGNPGSGAIPRPGAENWRYASFENPPHEHEWTDHAYCIMCGVRYDSLPERATVEPAGEPR